MKKTFVLTTLILSTLLIGCGTNSNASKDTETVKATETAHEHNYTETITLAATCETDGEATYTCDDCGDTYTEVIKATGHSFTNYVSNNDATYEADGTETAKCDNCDATDTRTAEGSKLAYTFKDMDATKYAKSTVNVRSMPTQDGEKVGSLSTNNEVKVTGQCNETGWYRIEYNGNTAYVSDSYLVDNKIETKKASSSGSNNSSGSSSSSGSSGSSNTASNSSTASSDSQGSSEPCPYTLYAPFDDGTTCYMYTPDYQSANADVRAKIESAKAEMVSLFRTHYPQYGSCWAVYDAVGTYDGVVITKWRCVAADSDGNPLN